MLHGNSSPRAIGDRRESNARVGRRLVIDHGTGVVIGETAEIDDDVTLYQGVTLAALRHRRFRQSVSVKRHPTLRPA